MDIPSDWLTLGLKPSTDLLAFATTVVMDALSDRSNDPASARLACYYDPGSGWAGVSFAELQRVDPGTITAADLHALTMLNAPVRAAATRRLLNDGDTRTDIEAALAEIAPTTALASATRADFEAMERLWLAVWRGCAETERSNPWVTVSKLGARKRPDLFPVRDRIVCTGLHLLGHPDAKPPDRRRDWQVFAHLMANREIADRIASHVPTAE